MFSVIINIPLSPLMMTNKPRERGGGGVREGITELMRLGSKLSLFDLAPSHTSVKCADH